MPRAAVLIGANRTGTLPVLHDAVAGARRMEEWALSQGMARERVLLFTDEDGPIDVNDIRKAIRKLVDSGSITQLIVYFAGHGVNIRYGEYWLLSEAPEVASAAVNVEGSMVLARRCGIPHVVFISDACRTAAEGVQAQGVTGMEIFPNDPVPGPESPVDIFFGTALGRPALEVKDPATSSAAFKAIYTAAMLDAMSGKLPTALTIATVDGKQKQLLRPRPLKALMRSELPQRLAALRLSADVTQIPDARITSDDDAWLASLDPVPVPSPPTTRGARPGTVAAAPPPSPPPPPPPPPTPEELAQHILLTTLSTDVTAARVHLRGGGLLTGSPGGVVGAVVGGLAGGLTGGLTGGLAGALAGGVLPGRSPDLDPQSDAGIHFETGCGFKVLGSTVVEALSARAQVGVKSTDATLVRVDTPERAVNVLLRLADGSAVLLPAVRDYVTLIRVDDDEVVDVSFEPCEGRPRFPAFTASAAAMRELRAVVSRAARVNAFRLNEQLEGLLNSRIVYDGHPDPGLTLYAAYAFHEMGKGDRVRELAEALEGDLKVRFFDLDLLSRPTGPQGQGTPPAQLPPMPMLARGWTLLSAFSVSLPEPLAGIERHLRPSLWTHFDRAGADRLHELILTRRLQ